MKTKSKVALSLAFVLLISCFAGCGASRTPAPAGSATSAPVNVNQEEVMNEYGWVVPNETLKFSIYRGAGNRDQLAEWEEQIDNFLRELFNVEITKIYSDQPAAEALSLMVVSNDYPDCISANRTIMEEWIGQGRAQDLTDLLPVHAPNIAEINTQSIMNIYKTDGRQYILPVSTGTLNIPGNSICLRWDWWEEIGSPKFDTMDEFYDVLIDINKIHTANLLNEKVYALGGYTNLNSVRTYVLGAYGFYATNWKRTGDTLTYWAMADEALDPLKYINRFFVDDMIDPDAYIQDYETYKTKLANERYITTIGGWHEGEQPLEVWLKEDDYVDTKRMVQFYPRQSPDFKLYYESSAGGPGIMITDKCKNPEDVLKFLNYSMTDIGGHVCVWGTPVDYFDRGVWTLVDGSPRMLDDVRIEFSEGTFDYLYRVFVGYNRHWFTVPMQFPNGTYSYIDQNVRDIGWKKVMFDNGAGTNGVHTPLAMVILPPEHEATTISEQITDVLNSELIKIYQAPNGGELVSRWDDLKARLTGIGIDKYQAYFNEQFTKNLSILNN